MSAICVALLATIGLCAAATARARGPELALRVGDYHLIARTTNRPECLPLPQQECFITFPNPSLNAPVVYAVWLGRIEPARTGDTFTVSKGRYLLRRPLRSN